MRHSLPLFVAALCLLGSTPVRAESPADLLRKGIDAFGLAQFDESRQALEQARASTREAALLSRIQLYLGLNAAVVGNTAAAREAFRQALSHDPTLAPDARAIKRELIDLFHEVRRGLFGKLVVRDQGERASVLLDGTVEGELPLSTEVPIGTHRVEVRSAAGDTLFTTQVVVAPEQTATVVAELHEPQGTLTVRSTPAGAQVSLDGKAIGRTPLIRAAVAAGPHQLAVQAEGHHTRVQEVTMTRDRETAVAVDLVAVATPGPFSVPTRRPRIWTWVAGGAAVVALATGIGLSVSSSSDFNQWEGHCLNAVTPACITVQRDIEDKDLAANVMFGVAAGLAATSVVLYLFEGRTTAGSERRTAITPLLGPLAGVTGTF